MADENDKKEVTVGVRVKKELKDAFYSKYSDNPSAKIRELMEIAVKDEYTGDKQIEQMKKRVQELRNEKKRIEREKEEKLEQLQDKIKMFEAEIDEKLQNQDTVKDKKKKLLKTTFNNLVNGGEELQPIKKDMMEYDIEKAEFDGITIESKEEWKKLLNEMLQEEGFDPEYIPVKYENDIGKEKIMKVGVEN